MDRSNKRFQSLTTSDVLIAASTALPSLCALSCSSKTASEAAVTLRSLRGSGARPGCDPRPGMPANSQPPNTTISACRSSRPRALIAVLRSWRTYPIGPMARINMSRFRRMTKLSGSDLSSGAPRSNRPIPSGSKAPRNISRVRAMLEILGDIDCCSRICDLSRIPSITSLFVRGHPADVPLDGEGHL